MNEKQVIGCYKRGMEISKSNLGIIEGVRGLYEGLSPISDVGNTASIAKALDAPVVLILDARSLVKSAAAVVLGFKALDKDVRIEGVILNKVKGDRHLRKAKESVEKLAGVPVIGGIPRSDEIAVEQRHLGLVPALERDRIQSNIEHWGQIAEEHIDLDALLDIAGTPSNIDENYKIAKENNADSFINPHDDDFNKHSSDAINLKVTDDSSKDELWKTGNKTPLRIGVALDEIFTFYYRETLESLEDNGARIIPFSPYKDSAIPDVDALYIGGGYPEVFAGELSRNKSMIESIRKFHEEGNPIYAECGGLIYLSKSIDGHGMADIVPYSSRMTDKVQGLNYVIARSSRDSLISNEGDIFRAHEFHYTKLDIDNEPQYAFDVLRGKGQGNQLDGISVGNTLANYIHIHACSHPNFGYNFTRNIAELQ